MVGVSTSVNFPLHHKVQTFSSGTGSSGWSWKKGCKTVVVWWRRWWMWGGAPAGHMTTSRDRRVCAVRWSAGEDQRRRDQRVHCDVAQRSVVAQQRSVDRAS